MFTVVESYLWYFGNEEIDIFFGSSLYGSLLFRFLISKFEIGGIGVFDFSSEDG
jgi:hypothetical protein